MTAFQGAVDATFAAFGLDAVYTPAGGEPVSVRVIAKRPDTIVGFGETRIYAETATFELRARPGTPSSGALGLDQHARPGTDRQGVRLHVQHHLAGERLVHRLLGVARPWYWGLHPVGSR